MPDKKVKPSLSKDVIQHLMAVRNFLEFLNEGDDTVLNGLDRALRYLYTDDDVIAIEAGLRKSKRPTKRCSAKRKAKQVSSKKALPWP